jgi:hypothetical protein
VIAAAAVAGGICALVWIAAGVMVWTRWGWPRARDRYYRTKGVPPAEM